MSTSPNAWLLLLAGGLITCSSIGGAQTHPAADAPTNTQASTATPEVDAATLNKQVADRLKAEADARTANVAAEAEARDASYAAATAQYEATLKANAEAHVAALAAWKAKIDADKLAYEQQYGPQAKAGVRVAVVTQPATAPPPATAPGDALAADDAATKSPKRRHVVEQEEPCNFAVCFSKNNGFVITLNRNSNRKKAKPTP